MLPWVQSQRCDHEELLVCLTLSLTVVSRAAGVVFLKSVSTQARCLPPRVSGVRELKERRVPCALLPSGGCRGEQEENVSKEAFFCLERLISPHPTSTYHDCILGRFFAVRLEGRKQTSPFSHPHIPQPSFRFMSLSAA